MPSYILLSLMPGSEPMHEHIDYVSDSQNIRIVVKHEQPERTALVEFSRYFVSRIAFNSMRIGQNRCNVGDITWLTGANYHSDMLPQGFSYYGKYYPAAYFARGGGDSYSVASFEAFDCPHCAYLKAVEICAATVMPEGVTVYPSVHQVSPACQPPTPDSHWTTCIDENGMISVSSSTEKLEFSATGCGNCGFPGHRRDTCPRPDKAYDRVGVEIEGRFLNVADVSREVRNSGATCCGDGSIRYGYTQNCEPLEIQTKPGTVVEQLRQLARFYPDESDTSCGMHIHVSFTDPGSVTALCSPEFMEYFTNRWNAWGVAQGLSPNSEFFRRLQGENDFCMPNGDYDFEHPYATDRYRQLNFLAWNEHKTIECRLLPMFRSARLAYSALVELVSIYEDWLAGIGTIHTRSLTNGEYSAALGQMTPVQSSAELDLSPYLGTPNHASVGFEVAELPPVPADCRRVCTTPTMRAQLDTWLPAAA